MSIAALAPPISSPPLDSTTSQCSPSFAHCPRPSVTASVAPDLKQTRSYGSSGNAVQHLLFPFHGITCMELASKSHGRCTLGSLQRRKPKRIYVRDNSGDDNMVGSDDVEYSSALDTVEQGKRILALQKELLGQIAERKKLVTALKESLGHAAEESKNYNSSNDVKLKQSIPLEEEPLKKSLVGGRRPISSDVTSSENLIYPLGPVSQLDASAKILKGQNIETEASPRTRPDENISPSPSRALNVPFPAQEVLIPGEDKKALQFVEESKEPVAKQPSEEPAITASVSTTEESSPPLAGQNVMNVVVVAAECAPWSKTGGLGDVAGALPKALARRGHRVMVVAPRYGQYKEARESGVRKRYKVAGQDLEVGYFHGYIDGVDYVFVDNSVFYGYANNIYGGKREDVLERMVLFCKAAVEVPWHVPCGGVCYGDGNLVFIANDWHTALIPVYLQAYYRDNGMMEFTRSVLVIHNMSHQGRGPLSDYSLLGLPDHYLDKFRLDDPIGGEHMNIFMAGLTTAHRIVAVSHGYAGECQTQQGGWGLDGVIRDYNWKLRGIVNGIDVKEWSPELDVHLKSDGYTNYSLDTLDSGKAVCKAALQKELGLPVRSDIPLLGFIGRLDHQKGVDIISGAMPWMMEQDLQLIMLGSGRADLENMLRSIEGQHRDKARAWVGFSVKIAHRITAGCDILLMPSRFEPCGLNQLYAMRYGTVPIVHAVGGLRDTVQAFDPYSNAGTGWTFDKADVAAMVHAVGNAMWTYRDFKESWRAIQTRGMSQDLSWDNAAKHYEEVMVAAKYQW